MSTYESEIEIETPIEYVFHWAISIENSQRSMAALTDVQVVE